MKFFKKIFSHSFNVDDAIKFLKAIAFYVVISVLAGLSGYVLSITPHVGFVFQIVLGVLSSIYSLVGVIIAFISFAKSIKNS